MRLHGALADEQPAGDLGVGQAERDFAKYVRLAIGQPPQLCGGRDARVGVLPQQPLDQARGDRGLAAGGGAVGRNDGDKVIL